MTEVHLVFTRWEDIGRRPLRGKNIKRGKRKRGGNVNINKNTQEKIFKLGRKRVYFMLNSVPDSHPFFADPNPA
jgi:hypothetical protein